MSCIPITLVGDNLGRRHRHLNALVAETYKSGVPFQDVEHLPEKSPVDRLFKIDLASKLRNVDYILRNIKDEDMLYVSRALKAKWILDGEYQCFINPQYLESSLYPYMVTTAVNKIKNWLYLNLKDPLRCADFYKYYSGASFNYAIKFLGRCTVDFILNETPNILEKLSPHYFKVLCEKCPQVAKIYFDNILINDEQKIKFLDNHLNFFNSLKVVLKVDAEIFFEIAEKYFDVKYGPSLTKYIMTHHKDRFGKKPELYAGRLLNIESIAQCLTPDECKELVLILARATYIRRHIDYKFVEPLIKRLPVKERAAFKKQVFVKKVVGDLVETWPYETPSLPTRKDYEIHVFDDRENYHFLYCEEDCFRQILKKRKYAKMGYCMESTSCRIRTYLDKLFDEYRFVSFERTFFELRKKIKEDSSSQNRQYMMLVLVSKSGGHPELVASLLQLLEQHSNEPANLRATIIRSLVKRAAVWRLPQQSWDTMLEFARGLGLDGGTPEADCREGLHAVVIRSLLETGECEPVIRNAFLKDFSHLDEYATNSNERDIIRQKLPLLLIAAFEAEISSTKQVELLGLLLDMLQKYKVNIEKSSLIPAVASLVKKDLSTAEDILRRLFNAKIGRRTLFQEMFPLVQTDASYLNALRHDTSILNVSKFVDLIEKGEIRPEKFLRKLAIYFAESLGMMEVYRTELQGRVLTNPSIGKSIARPLGLLQGACLSYLQSLDVSKEAIARLAPAIRANMHAGRPKLDMTEIDLPTLGAKAIANKVLVCPAVDADNYIVKLLKWKRTVRLAVLLAERIGKEGEVFAAAAAVRPTTTLKTAVKYIHRRNTDFDSRVWEIFKQLINDFDMGKEKHVHIRKLLKKVDKVPSKIKPAYCTILFKALKKDFHFDAISVLSNIEDCLFNVDEDFLEQQLLDFLQEFDPEKCKQNDDFSYDLHLRILIKFLLLCEVEETQKKRYKILCEPLFKCLASSLDKSQKDFTEIFNQILLLLQYNRAFFDDNYVSPLPVFENIVSWMRQYLPIEMHFNKYVRIHLTMLYLKSIRQSIKSNPEILKNEKRKLSEGISVVGITFGKNIAQEVKQLTDRYFESSIELYRTGMEKYFDDYFQYDITKYKFVKAVVQGILKGSVGDEIRTALYMIANDCTNFEKKDFKELIDGMQEVKDEKFQYFLHAEWPNLRNNLTV